MIFSARSGGPDSFVYRTLAGTLRDIALGHLATRNKQHKLFADLRRMGLTVPAPPAAWEEDSRSIIHLSAVTAVARFMQHQVMDGGWNATRGVSLTTYFVNAALFAFAHEYRRYHRSQSAGEVNETPRGDVADALDQHRTQRAPDPEETAVERDMIARALPMNVDWQLRYAFYATAEGRSQAEIAEYLGMTAEAVSSMLRRYRRQHLPTNE